jgi:hypothetical protein
MKDAMASVSVSHYTAGIINAKEKGARMGSALKTVFGASFV